MDQLVDPQLTMPACLIGALDDEVDERQEEKQHLLNTYVPGIFINFKKEEKWNIQMAK